ncbi:MAG: hypothetical protein HYR85_20945 [Planctomycetes bacterium]|nr:hypothetical protein [Planctomycetota bacterium]MBI3844905.1 hypothetical protein [Planctomycetota bacterium]
MNRKWIVRSVSVAVVVGLAAVFSIKRVGASNVAPPSIEGTYVLVSRDLPDGTKQAPPVVVGLMTYTKEYRNFNVYWKDAKGKSTSISSIATYKLTEKTYDETNVYYMVNDESGGKGVTYDVTAATGSSPISMKDGRIEMQLPLHGEPKVVFAGDTMTATREGAFVDHWKKVR